MVLDLRAISGHRVVSGAADATRLGVKGAQMAIVYRREVDGLRAIAVVPVVLFHANFDQIPGGYIGVEVFFVISGFLITSIILSEQAAGNFTVLGFYERRVRRILPALFTVISASIVLGWICMVPHTFKNFGESVAAVAVFGSNFLFLSESGYFAPAAESIPLLHTWSLAVEEQYYLIAPLFLLLFASIRRSWLLLLIGIVALASLAFAEWGWRHAPFANFYLLPSRAWELSIGGLIAVALLNHDIRSHLGTATRNLLSVAGLTLILGAMLVFDQETPIPSVYTLIPVGGAALILATATGDTLVGKVLSSTPLVFVGLISYSTYLWHMPVLNFAKIVSIDPPTVVIRLMLIAVTVVLAYLTWRFIENPFRKRHFLGRRTVFVAAVSASAIFAAAGVSIAMTDGFKMRSSSYYVSFEKKKERSNSWKYVNRYRDRTAQINTGSISEIATEDKLKVAIVGNSHAKDLYNILYILDLKIDLEPVITNRLCRGIQKKTKRWRECNLEYVVEPLEHGSADKVIIAPRWTVGHVDALPMAIAHIKARGKEVAVFGNTAEFQDVPAYFAKNLGFGRDESVGNLRKIEKRAAGTIRSAKLKKLNTRIREIARQHGIVYIDRSSLLCTGEKCTLLDDDLKHILYDYGHLTLGGARFVGRRLLKDRKFMSFLGEHAVQSRAK